METVQEKRPWFKEVAEYFPGKATCLVLAGLGLALMASFWTTLGTMADRWSNPQYSHGFLVPVFALVVLWFRRQRLKGVAGKPSWWGLAFLAAGFGLRIPAAVMDLQPADGLSLLVTLAGLVVLLGGWGVWRWAWPAIAFLGFMLPLPYFVETALGQPLRRLATNVSTYALQTLGYPALAEGNVIHIEELELFVIDACSGLGMLFTFFALATAMALVVRLPLTDRLVIVASAVPIALIANVARITATAMAHYALGSEAGHFVMHGLAGWLMMPLALGLLWLELWFFGRLFPARSDSPPLPLALPVRKPDLPPSAGMPVSGLKPARQPSVPFAKTEV